MLPGDYVSMGWTISLPGAHPATSVTVSDIVATIPLDCEARGQHSRPVNLVIQAPQTTVALPLNDNAWHATASPALAQAYQAKVLVGELCPRGALEPHGKATYAAKLVSTDTKDPFALRFHSVDARTNLVRFGEPNPNTDCTSIVQNPTGVAQCNAAWTPVTKALALAPPRRSAAVPGRVAAWRRVGGVTGVGPARWSAASPAASVLSSGTPCTQRSTRPRHGVPRAPRQAGQQPGGTSAAATQPAPVLVLPAPSQSAVLGPVPLPVPVIDSVAAGVGGALPWKWFLLLAIVDVALIVAIVVRRRLAQHDRLNPR